MLHAYELQQVFAKIGSFLENKFEIKPNILNECHLIKYPCIASKTER